MDVAFLLDKYFKDGKNVSIDVFDAHTLNTVYKDVVAATESVIENGFWQGTLIYMVIGTGEEIDPNQIVDHRKVNPLAERSILVALQRRYNVIKNEQ